MRQIWETKLSLINAFEAIEGAVNGLKDYCCSITQKNGQYNLDFETAIAAIRTHEGNLLIRVEAEEFAVGDGTKMIITSQLSQHARDMPMNVLWIRGSEEPFATILNSINWSDLLRSGVVSDIVV